MSYLVLARKWRPMRFEDLVGQDHVARILGNAIKNNRVAHAFLFTGVRGVGKTTSARILAKALNCLGDPETTPPGKDPGPTASPCLKCAACLEIALGTDMDVREIDGASYNGVDEVRKLQDGVPYRPARDRFKIYIVDEVHMLSQSAWNAFLKTLEEPPPHVKFIFATTEVHKVPVTILSRVQRFDFKLISAQLIAERLRHVLRTENIQADDAAVAILSREAAGSMRDAMSLLDQVIAWGGEEGLRGEDVARVLGVASHAALYELGRALVSGDAAGCLTIVADLANQGHELGHVARDVLRMLRNLVVAKVCPDPRPMLDLPNEEAEDIEKLAAPSQADELIRLHQGFAQGFDEVSRSGQPRAALEMLLVRLARRPPLVPVDGLVQRLSQLERRLGTGPQRPPGAARGPASQGGEGAAGSSPRGRETRPAREPRSESSDDRGEPPAPRPAERPSVPAERPSVPAERPARPAERPARPTERSSNGRQDPPATVVAAADLDALFRRIVERVAGERSELAAKLEHAVALELKQNRLLLGWAPGSVFGELVAEPEITAVVERAATAVLEAPVRIAHEHASERAAGRRTLSDVTVETRERKRREAYEEARQHPKIAEAVEILGARLKDLKLAKTP